MDNKSLEMNGGSDVVDVNQFRPSVLPEKIAYRLMDSAAGLIKSRNVTYFKSDQSNYSELQIIKFTLNSAGFFDGQNSYLKFNFKPSNPHYGVRGSVGRLIQRCRITSGSDGTLISDISGINEWDDILKKNTYSKSYKATRGSIEGLREPGIAAGGLHDGYVYTTGSDIGEAFGYNSATPASSTDYAGACVNGGTYCIPLTFCPTLFNSKLIPMKPLGSLVVELSLEKASKALQFHKLDGSAATDSKGLGVDPNYTVSNVELCMDTVLMSDLVNQAVESLASQSKILLPIKEVYVNSTSSGTVGTNQSFQLSKPVYDMQSVFVQFRDSANLSNPDADSFNSIEGKFLNNYQFNHASTFYPSRPISTVAEAYSECQRAFNALHDIKYSNYGIDDYNKTNLLIGLECERDPSSNRTGLSSKFNQLMQINYGLNTTLSTPPPASVVLTWYMLYLKTIEVGPNGSLKVSE